MSLSLSQIFDGMKVMENIDTSRHPFPRKSMTSVQRKKEYKAGKRSAACHSTEETFIPAVPLIKFVRLRRQFPQIQNAKNTHRTHLELTGEEEAPVSHLETDTPGSCGLNIDSHGTGQ